MASKNCDICGATLELFKKHKAADGHICHSCFTAAGFSTGMVCFASTIDQLRATLGGDAGAIKSGCAICGKGAKKYYKAKDGSICNECYTAAGFPAAVSISLIPLSVLTEQVNSVDGKSIIKRFTENGGVMPATKASAPISNSKVPKCPKCTSTSISADKKGFGVGKAVAGAALAGPIGLVAGNIGAKQVRVTCLNCGHQWTAGKA